MVPIPCYSITLFNLDKMISGQLQVKIPTVLSSKQTSAIGNVRCELLDPSEIGNTD